MCAPSPQELGSVRAILAVPQLELLLLIIQHTPPSVPQERGFSSHNAYSLSKLAEQLFTFELANRLRAAGSPVTCNCLDPGGQRGPIGVLIRQC